MTPLFKRWPIFQEIESERDRQEEKWGEQDHLFGTGLDFLVLAEEAKKRIDAKVSAGKDPTWQMILDEEVLEAFTETDWGKLRAELVQVAAVVVAWIESGDRQSSRKAEASWAEMGQWTVPTAETS